MRRWLFIIALLMPSALIAQDKGGFYGDQERGWFWFEQKLKELEEEPKKPVAPAAQSSKKSEEDESIAIDIKWLRKNLPRLRETAINNPTRENIAAHMYAQRYMLDMSSRFSNKSMEFMEFEGPLDESKRRPYAAFSLAAFKEEQKNNIKRVIEKVNSNSHIWFFYASDCPYCIKQVGVLRELQVRFGLDVLAISMDGGTLPGVENFTNVVDTSGVAQRFGVQYTPTMFLALDGDKGFTSIGEGLTTLPSLQERILLGARMQNLITDDEYQSTQDVREINVLSNENGTMVVDKELIESDPGYLAEILRQKLINTSQTSATPINKGEQ